MTTGEMLYLALLLATFAGFAFGIGPVSWQHTQATMRARRAPPNAPQSLGSLSGSHS